MNSSILAFRKPPSDALSEGALSLKPSGKRYFLKLQGKLVIWAPLSLKLEKRRGSLLDISLKGSRKRGWHHPSQLLTEKKRKWQIHQCKEANESLHSNCNYKTTTTYWHRYVSTPPTTSTIEVICHITPTCQATSSSTSFNT